MKLDHVGKESLTKAEAEVLALVEVGFSNLEIAVSLSIALGTVKCHLHRVYGKLRARNRLQAIVNAREQGHLLSRRGTLATSTSVNFDG